MLIGCGSTAFFYLRIWIATNIIIVSGSSLLSPGISIIFFKDPCLLYLVLFPRIATNFARNHTTAPYYRAVLIIFVEPLSGRGRFPQYPLSRHGMKFPRVPGARVKFSGLYYFSAVFLRPFQRHFKITLVSLFFKTFSETFWDYYVHFFTIFFLGPKHFYLFLLFLSLSFSLFTIM